MTPDSRTPGFGSPSKDSGLRIKEEIDARSIQSTAFPAGLYYEIFHFTEASFRNKSVLDVGAGASGFVPHLLSRGVDAYALDPKFVPGRYMDLVADVRAYHTSRAGLVGTPPIMEMTLSAFTESVAQHPDRYVYGYASKLPWPDNRFDVVVSSQLHIKYLIAKPEVFNQSMRELVRVLKPGGMLKISPSPKIDPPFGRLARELNDLIREKMLQNQWDGTELLEENVALAQSLALARILDQLTSEGLVGEPKFKKAPNKKDMHTLEMRKKRK